MLFTFGKFYFVDLAFWHHSASNVLSHCANDVCGISTGENFNWKNAITLSRTLTAENKNSTSVTFVTVLRSLAASACELLPDVSMANTSLYERVIFAALRLSTERRASPG